jgi:DNA helicase II / ATP-dependent DNA helicase PcrA
MLGDLTPQAENALNATGLDVRYPLWERSGVQRGGCSIHEVRAVNLLSGYMMVPVPADRGLSVQWRTLTCRSALYAGLVWSLDVEKDHTYIADGLVTHNCIYNFKGATPDAFLNPPVDDAHKRVLDQSYRLPRAVYAYAERWLTRLSAREPKAYAPRDAEGRVWHRPDLYLRRGNDVVAAVQDLLTTHATVMVLTTCGYQLQASVIPALRQAGVPFHNPYARHHGAWNPLHGSGGVSTAARVAAYQRVPWTGQDLALWAPLVKADGIFQKGQKHAIAALGTRESLGRAELGDYFCSPALAGGLRGDPRWLLEHATTEYKPRLAYPLAIVESQGAGALREAPRVVVGTIHSVKGGEAAAVILFPDLSLRGRAAMGTTAGGDALVRQMYVGMTRARETLVIAGGGHGAVSLP